MNVWVPDELAERARAGGLNVSALTQAALQAELDRHATDSWLEQLALSATSDRSCSPRGVEHAAVLAALDDARAEFDPGRPGAGSGG